MISRLTLKKSRRKMTTSGTSPAVQPLVRAKTLSPLLRLGLANRGKMGSLREADVKRLRAKLGSRLDVSQSYLRTPNAAHCPLPSAPTSVMQRLVDESPRKRTRPDCLGPRRQRSLPRADAEACRVKFDGIHLDVHAPETFVQRLRAAKSEPLHEESGLLAGDGYLRPAALLRLQTLA